MFYFNLNIKINLGWRAARVMVKFWSTLSLQGEQITFPRGGRSIKLVFTAHPKLVFANHHFESLELLLQQNLWFSHKIFDTVRGGSFWFGFLEDSLSLSHVGIITVCCESSEKKDQLNFQCQTYQGQNRLWVFSCAGSSIQSCLSVWLTDWDLRINISW